MQILGFTLAPYRDLAVSTKPLVLLSLRSPPKAGEGGHLNLIVLLALLLIKLRRASFSFR